MLLKRRSLTLHPGHHHERLQKPEGDSKDILKDLVVYSNTKNIWDWGLLGLGSDPKEEPDPEEKLGSDPEARSLDILLRYLLACSTTPEVKLGYIPVVELGTVEELGSGLEVELDKEEEPEEGGDLLLSNHPGEE